MIVSDKTKQRLEQQLRVYAITDERSQGEDLLGIVEQAIAGGATAIQLRRKSELGRQFVELGQRLRAITREHGVLFFVNDRVDVAYLVDADGVHIGQDDISCLDARKLLGSDKIIGVSAETVAEAVTAEREGADYLGVGAVYPTSSKDDAGYTGLTGLRAIVEAVSIPIVGIGGITVNNAAAVLQGGACGVAVVSAIMSARDVRGATADLVDALRMS